VGILTLNACQKDNILNEDKTVQSLSKAEIRLIGTEHNRLLIDVINRLKNNAVNTSNIQFNAQKSIQTNYVGNNELFSSLNYVLGDNGYPPLQQDEFNYYLTNYNDEVISTTVSNTISSISNQQQSSIMGDLVTSINNTSDYNTLSQQLSGLQQRAETELSGTDQTSTLIAIEVASNSGYMWLPVEEGGLGYYDQSIATEVNKRYQKLTSESGTFETKEPIRVNMKQSNGARTIAQIIVADAVGAFAGFLRAALPYFLSGGPVNPVSNGILFGSALIGGISSSAMAGIGAAMQ